MIRTLQPPTLLYPKETTRTRFPWWAMGLTILAVCLALFLSLYNSRWFALRRMPAAERAQLFQSVRETVKTTCPSPEPALQAECRDQLDLLFMFPECDAGCEALAAQYRPLPHK